MRIFSTRDKQKYSFLSLLKLALVTIFFIPTLAKANPIISGISTNEINIDTNFKGTKILLFGAKDDSGDVIVVVRGPKKNFLVTKKDRFLGIWHNGERVKFKDSYSFYSLFSTFHTQVSDQKNLDRLLSNLQLGENNLTFDSSSNIKKSEEKEFRLHLVDKLQKAELYSIGSNKIEFLDETLFKVFLNFPKNISRGVYTVEIYLISDGQLSSFQSIPIYVNQVGLSAKISDFSEEQSFLYGLMAVGIALLFGWLTNYFFIKFFSK